MNLFELIVVVVIVGLLAAVTLGSGREPLARQRLEAASRELWLGLEEARDQAQRQGIACALDLDVAGWQAPSGGNLGSCDLAEGALLEGNAQAGLRLSHNLGSGLSFTPNGLVLSGGTVVLAYEGTSLQRCLVVSLPLGITRLGRYANGSCLPDDS
jgi:Tfp pilus assembly protein FimT